MLLGESMVWTCPSGAQFDHVCAVSNVVVRISATHFSYTFQPCFAVRCAQIAHNHILGRVRNPHTSLPAFLNTLSDTSIGPVYSAPCASV